MKHSLRARITVILMLTIGVTIISCWIVNRTFLEAYYISNKMDSLEDAFFELNTVFESYTQQDEEIKENNSVKNENPMEEGVLDSDIDAKDDEDADSSCQEDSKGKSKILEEDILYISRIEASENVKIFVLQPQVYVSGFKKFKGYEPIYPDDAYDNMDTNREYNRILESIKLYYNSSNNDDRLVTYGTAEKEIESFEASMITEDYTVYKQFNRALSSEYMDLYGFIGDNYMILIRTDLESIQEGVLIANKFLQYVGGVMLMLSSLVIFFLSESVTRPVKELSNIAKEMSNLNFDVKYKVENTDEIGELGKSINILSEKLELTISDLKQANIKLQSDIDKKLEIDEMRKDFLSNVTHELKTPIALIQGYAEGLKENINDSPESRDFYCEVIMDEADKMNKMVKKLLSLNQIEFGNTELEIERFDIIPIIKSAITSSDILIKQKNISVKFDETESFFVWADEYMIEEVVTNYLSNAINHVEEPNIIEIKLIKRDNSLRVAFYNTGKNIPEEELDNIWIKFYKVDKARTREYGGSGIGLSIVKAIMKSHNKECGVKNHEAGVEFWFELDCSED